MCVCLSVCVIMSACLCDCIPFSFRLDSLLSVIYTLQSMSTSFPRGSMELVSRAFKLAKILVRWAVAPTWLTWLIWAYHIPGSYYTAILAQYMLTILPWCLKVNLVRVHLPYLHVVFILQYMLHVLTMYMYMYLMAMWLPGKVLVINKLTGTLSKHSNASSCFAV